MNSKDLFTEFAVKVGRVSLLKKMLRKPYDLYKKRGPQKALDNFKKYGFEALALFDKCLTDHHVQYSLAFGTLLGAIREHDFIPYDDDIDVAMWIDDYTPELINYLDEAGIKLKHTFSVDNDKQGKEDTFVYKGVLIDIFYFYKDNQSRVYCCDFVNQHNCSSRSSSVKKHGGLLPRKIYVPLAKSFTRIKFKGIETSIPTNYEEILSFRYGEDYMTPKPGWKPKTEYIVEKPDWLGIYKDY